MKKEYKIDGMSCQHCVKAVEKELEKLPLLNKNVEIGNAKIEFDDSKVSDEAIKKAIEEAGYKVVE